MLSRVRSLKGLCILRPFTLDRIKNHISQELRQELERVSTKAENTKQYCQEQFSWFYDVLPASGVSELGKQDCECILQRLDQIKGTIPEYVFLNFRLWLFILRFL
jgi:hypothetical protein